MYKKFNNNGKISRTMKIFLSMVILFLQLNRKGDI